MSQSGYKVPEALPVDVNDANVAVGLAVPPASSVFFARHAMAIAILYFAATFYAHVATNTDERLVALAHVLLGGAVAACVMLGEGGKGTQRALLLSIVVVVWLSYAAMRAWRSSLTVEDALQQCSSMYDSSMCAQLRQTWTTLRPQLGGTSGANGCMPAPPVVAYAALVVTLLAGLAFFSTTDMPVTAYNARLPPQWGAIVALGALALWVGWLRWTHQQLNENPIADLAQNEYLQAPLQRITKRLDRHRTYTVGGALLVVYLLVRGTDNGKTEAAIMAAIAAAYLLIGIPMLQNLRNLVTTLEQWVPMTRGIPSLHYEGKTRPDILREGLIVLSVAVGLACGAQLVRTPKPSYACAAVLAVLFIGLVFLYDAPGMLRYHVPDDMPPGSWRASARYPVMRDGELHAQLKTFSGEWVGAGTKIPPSPRTLSNIDGKFRIDPLPETASADEA